MVCIPAAGIAPEFIIPNDWSTVALTNPPSLTAPFSLSFEMNWPILPYNLAHNRAFESVRRMYAAFREGFGSRDR